MFVKLDLNRDAKGDYVVITPLLLNKKDSLKIQLLFEDFDKIYIQGRIVEIEKIKEIDYSFNFNLSVYIVTVLFSFTMLLIFVILLLLKVSLLVSISFFISSFVSLTILSVTFLASARD